LFVPEVEGIVAALDLGNAREFCLGEGVSIYYALSWNGISRRKERKSGLRLRTDVSNCPHRLL
jgi:hypothetical protein